MMNPESVNNRFKPAFHRLAARRLKSSPALLDGAQSIVRAWRSYPGAPAYVAKWDGLLSRSIEDIRSEIVSRSEYHDLLRSCSPFSRLLPTIIDEEDLRRLWRIVRKAPTAA